MLAAKPRTSDIRSLAARWLQNRLPPATSAALSLGLPEWDARLELWRVALVSANHPDAALGEIQVDAAGAIQRTPDPALVAQRLHCLAQSSRRNGVERSYAGKSKSRIAFPLSAIAPKLGAGSSKVRLMARGRCPRTSDFRIPEKASR